MVAGKSPPRAGRTLSAEEAHLWAEVMRDTQVHDPAVRRRSAPDAAAVPSPPAAPDIETARQSAPVAPAKARTVPVVASRITPAVPTPGTGTDRRTQVRLRRGQLDIDGRLDLHGLTQQQARPALEGFLSRSVAAGHRCVLVITGKGSSRPDDEPGFMPERERGILREQVPRWLVLPPLAQQVVTWQPAARQHGGDGALYILLRRKK